LIDQFYSHQLPGSERSAITGVRGFLRRQQQLKESVQSSTDLLRSSLKQLMLAYPEVTRQGFTREFAQLAGEGEGQAQPPCEGIKCPTRYMESSIAVVMEHTEKVTMNIKRDDDAVIRMPSDRKSTRLNSSHS
jgi:preprotein translocase subunit SecD